MKKIVYSLFLSLMVTMIYGDIYVSLDGTGTGTDWEHATNDLNNAITACGSGETVWVSNGTYNVNLVMPSGAIMRSIYNNRSEVILNGMASGNVVIMDSDGGTIIGFTVTNGNSIIGSGGGIDCVTQNGIVSNCVVKKNSASGGGGINSGKIYNSIICENVENAAGGGGCINSTLFDCIISNNSAGASDGGGVLNGTISNCIIIANSTINNGGGAYNCTIYNSIISNNTAYASGGGVNVGTIYNSIIDGNIATITGPGGIRSVNAYNCLIKNNYDVGTVWEAGGALECSLYNCTLTKNNVQGARFCNLYNSISYDNAAADNFTDINDPYSKSTNQHSCGNFVYYDNDLAETLPYYGHGSINDNPLFSNSDYNYKLQSISPCVDTGSNEIWSLTGKVDLAGSNRVFNLIVDMGCYEYSYLIPKKIFLFSQPPYTGPMVTNLIVTGTISPDIRGTYVEGEAYGGYRAWYYSSYYIRVEGMSYILYYDEMTWWQTEAEDYNPVSSYSAQMMASGTPLVNYSIVPAD